MLTIQTHTVKELLHFVIIIIGDRITTTSGFSDIVNKWGWDWKNKGKWNVVLVYKELIYD